MADEDDLPPGKRERDVEDRSFFGGLGELFGASIWLLLFVAIGGGVLYFLVRASH